MKLAKPLLLICLFAFGAGVSGCYTNQSDAADATIGFRSSLSGPQERPVPVITTGSGTVSAFLRSQTNQFEYTITWNRLTDAPIAMHFHGPAGRDEVAPPVVPVINFPARRSGSVSGKVNLTPEQANELRQNRWYFNIHTPLYPPGEIRGQVIMGN